YLMAALPAVARRLSPAGDAYEYLAESIRDWPSRGELAQRIGGAGWSAAPWRDLTPGVVTVHTARRRGGEGRAPAERVGRINAAAGRGLDSGEKALVNGFTRRCFSAQCFTGRSGQIR